MTEFRPSPESRSKLFDWYFIAAILGAAILLFATLLLPLGFDNDVYQSMGWTLWTYHGLPYLASWDMNFPGIVFIHAASIALFGSSDFGFRLFDYLTHIVMAGMFYIVLRRWLRPRTSLAAILIWAIYYANGQWGLAGQRDTYAVFFLLAGVLLLFSLREKGISIARSLALGVASGCAILIRPTYALFFLSFLWLIWNLPAPNRSKGIAYFIAGTALVISAFLLPYFFVTGGLEQIYDSVIRFNLDVYSHIPVQISFWRLALIYTFALIGILVTLFRPSDDPLRLPVFDRTFFFLMLASSIISPVVMGKYFSYHLHPLMTIVTVFSAIGLVRLGELARLSWAIWAIEGVLLALLVAVLYPRHLDKYFFQEWKTGHPFTSTYARIESDNYGIQAQEEVIQYVDHHTQPDDPVEYASVFASLRWRLARKSATRFTTLVPVVPPVSFHAPYLERWQQEYLTLLATVRPAFIILTSSLADWPFTHSSAAQAPHLIPGFDSLIAADFKLDTVIRGFILYRPKS
jgi:hypothetical protein